MFASESKFLSIGANAGLASGQANVCSSIGHAVVKAHPEDFLVSESLVLPICVEARTAKFTYLRLTKMGFTTFEAADTVAEHFGVPRSQVMFAGLKDEDAITDQVIATEGRVSHELIELFNTRYNSDTRRFMNLRHWGVGNEPIRVGLLNGNSFRLVVRNLPQHFAQRFTAANRYTFLFFNYYDTQRFGVAQQPKLNHLIGQALIDNDFDAAFELFKQAGSTESQQTQGFRGSHQEFFSALNPQLVKFFKDSYSSHLWNQRLARLVKDVCGDQAFEESCDNVSFTFTGNQSQVLSVLKEKQSLEFMKFHDDSNGGANVPKLRATAIQIQILCNSMVPDEDHPGAYKNEFSFFLPSGSYATMCIKQLLHCSDFQ